MSVRLESFLIRWMINTIALSAAVQVIPGLHFTDGPLQLLAVALVFGVVNAVLRPILTVLSCPLVLLTLGLFTLVINGVMLMLTARLAALLAPRVPGGRLLARLLGRAGGGHGEPGAGPAGQRRRAAAGGVIGVTHGRQARG